MTKREIRQFLLAFVNRGCRTSETADELRADLRWFETHRIFTRLLPAPPRVEMVRKDPGMREYNPASLACARFKAWRYNLRTRWSLAGRLGEYELKEQFTAFVAAYIHTHERPELERIFAEPSEPLWGPWSGRVKWAEQVASRLARVRPPEGFLRALFQLRDSAGQLRLCGNPDCLKPFFFAVRERDRFCGPACRAVGSLEYKKRWWSKHGPAWRRARKAKNRRKKSQRKRGKRR